MSSGDERVLYTLHINVINKGVWSDDQRPISGLSYARNARRDVPNQPEVRQSPLNSAPNAWTKLDLRHPTRKPT